MPRVFPSKIDWPLVLAPLLLVLASLGAVLALVGPQLPAGARAAVLLGVIVVPGFLLWAMLATDYTLDSRTLTVRCGPFRWRIGLAEIRAVTATRDPSSGPALSLERLRVDYGRDRAILISPRDAGGFLKDLERLRAQAAPGPGS
jgi:Bacterial PH domain